MLACACVSPMLGTAHNSLKASGADWGVRRITSHCLCPRHSVSLGTPSLCSVKGTETLFDVEADGPSVKHSQDQLESIMSCETPNKVSLGCRKGRGRKWSYWGVIELAKATGTQATIPLSLLNRLFQRDYGFLEQCLFTLPIVRTEFRSL